MRKVRIGDIFVLDGIEYVFHLTSAAFFNSALATGDFSGELSIYPNKLGVMSSVSLDREKVREAVEKAQAS